jgi:hypothetical protein
MGKELDPALAHMGGWLLAPCVNAFFIATLLPAAGWSTGLTHHLYDFGHFLAVGLFAAAVVHAWRRIGPKRGIWAWASLASAALAVGFHVLPEDLDNFSRNFPGPREAVLPTLVVAVSLVVPTCAVAGQIAAGRSLRWLGLSIAVALFAANNLAFARDYEGGHLMLAWGAASLAGGALVGVPVPEPVRRLGTRHRWGFLLLGVLLAAWTLFVAPPSAVAVRLVTLDGSVPAQRLAQLREDQIEAQGIDSKPIANDQEEWFTDRSARPPIPPYTRAIAPDEPIVVLITIDSMRAEVLRDDKHRLVMPRLREIAEQSTVFGHARAPGSSTLTVMSSLFTGKHRTQLRWQRTKRLRWNLVKDDTERLTESMSAAGIESFQSVSFEFLRQKYGVTRGFTHERFIEPPQGQRFALADQMLAALLERIERHGGGPLFVHAHLMDPHYPYDAAGEFDDAWDGHLAELELCDREIGRLWDRLHQLGVSDRLVFIVSADHGEGFGQHNTPYHSNTVYEELVRVPLMVHVPNVRPRQVQAAVSLIDVGPTILDLFGLPTPPHYMGQSLVPFIAGDDPILTRPIAGTARVAGKRPIYYYWMPDGYKLIWNLKLGTREIYDLANDPAEEVNLFDADDEDSRERMDLLRRFFGAHPYYFTGAAPKTP